MGLDEEYTARVQADRPDGAAVLARIDVGLRMPAGERVIALDLGGLERVREVVMRQLVQRFQGAAVAGVLTLMVCVGLYLRWRLVRSRGRPG